jgi:osmotically-inducible protein OsmY
MNRRLGQILVGLSTVLLTAAWASASPKAAAQANADHVLAIRVKSALDGDPIYFFRHVDVRADDGRVSLYGYVWSDAAIRRAERVASQVPGVTSVADQLTLVSR